MKRPLILLFIILCVFGVPLGAAPPEAPLKDPGTDLNGTITVSPSSPNGSWPSSGESSSLSPKRTASITVTVLDGKDPNGVSYSVKKTQVLSAKCDDPNVLWIKPADGRGTFQLTNTSQDACGAAFTVKITWTPDAGSGGGGGSPPPDIEGTAAGSVSLLDSKAYFSFDPAPTPDYPTDVVVTTPAADNGPVYVSGHVEFADSENRRLTVELKTLEPAMQYYEPDLVLTQWSFFTGPMPNNVQTQTFTIFDILASMGEVAARWNDGTEESAASTETVNYLRIKASVAGQDLLTARPKLDLWYFDDGQSFASYPRKLAIHAEVLPPQMGCFDASADLDRVCRSGQIHTGGNP